MLEEDCSANEEVIITCNGFLEMLESRGKITVGEAKEYESFIRRAYEIAFGSMFDSDDGKDYAVQDENRGPHKQRCVEVQLKQIIIRVICFFCLC